MVIFSQFYFEILGNYVTYIFKTKDNFAEAENWTKFLIYKDADFKEKNTLAF